MPLLLSIDLVPIDLRKKQHFEEAFRGMVRMRIDPLQISQERQTEKSKNISFASLNTVLDWNTNYVSSKYRVAFPKLYFIGQYS